MELYEIIVYHYIELLNEYLQHMKQSETLRTIPNSTYILCIGLNAILHIFKMILYKTKNIEITYSHCQKAAYCYLEYIEQMNKTFTLHNLNNLDAVAFIYKNATADISSPSERIHSSTSSRSLKNKMTMQTADPETLHRIVKNISLITHHLLLFKEEMELETEVGGGDTRTIEHMGFLLNHFFKRFFVLTYPRDQSYIFDYIKHIKAALQLDFQEYCEFLKQVYRVLKKTGSPEEPQLREKYIQLFVNRENRVLLERLRTEKKMEEITKMIF